MLIKKIGLVVFFSTIILNSPELSQGQDNYPKVYSLMYQFDDIMKIICDSTLLNGYLVFEFDKANNNSGFDKSKKFFTFDIFFVMNLDDINSTRSAKFYYNSNKLSYKSYTFFDVSESDSVDFVEKVKFKKVYDIYLQNSKSNHKPFRIETLNFNLFKEDKDENFYQLDSLSDKGYFIFSFKVSAFLFTAPTYKTLINNSGDEKITILFFEPLSEAMTFESVNKSATLSKGFIQSNWIKKFLNN